MVNASESYVNKFRKFTGQLRTDIELSRKSKLVNDKDEDAILQEARHILDSKDIIYPPTLSKYGLSLETTYDEKKAILETLSAKRIPNEAEKRFIKFMERSQQKSTQTNWRFRIAEEAEQKQKQGWYPFFITLTVDPKLVDSKEMWQSGRQWQKLVRRLSKIASNEMGHMPFWKQKIRNKKIVVPYRPITDYLTYAAVLEHGKSREHHHVHALIWLKEIPASWKLCPNRNAIGKHKIHNRCRPLETYWHLGMTEANYFRSVGDIYEIKHNFVLPLKDGKPMKVSSAAAAGAYITKYLQKDHKEWAHRMKATRNLGLIRLKQTLNQMDKLLLQALTWRPMNGTTCHSLSLIHTVPLGLIRQLAKQKHFYNQYQSNQLDSKKLTMILPKPYIKMLRSVQNGARPDRMGFVDYYDWLSQLLPEQKEYCDSLLLDAHEYISKLFPKLIQRQKSIKLGANKI